MKTFFSVPMLIELGGRFPKSAYRVRLYMERKMLCSQGASCLDISFEYGKNPFVHFNGNYFRLVRKSKAFALSLWTSL